MMNLAEVLARHVDVGPKAGRASAPDNAQLRADLEQVRREGAKVFWIWVGAILVLFVLSLVVFAVWVRNPWEAAGVLAAAGLSIPKLLQQLQKAWEQKVQADTLLVLAATMDPQVMKSVLRAFLRKFAGESSGRELTPAPAEPHGETARRG
jgi:hypothetical protein